VTAKLKRVQLYFTTGSFTSGIHGNIQSLNLMNSCVFWNISPRGPMKINRRFEVTSLLSYMSKSVDYQATNSHDVTWQNLSDCAALAELHDPRDATDSGDTGPVQNVCMAIVTANTTIAILDSIRRPVFYLKRDVLGTGFCLRFRWRGPIGSACPYLQRQSTVSETSSFK
jgi:hypothetical protein